VTQFARGKLRMEQLPAPHCTLESSVCAPLRRHFDLPLGQRLLPVYGAQTQTERLARVQSIHASVRSFRPVKIAEYVLPVRLPGVMVEVRPKGTVEPRSEDANAIDGADV
jgi:hypothetical protein